MAFKIKQHAKAAKEFCQERIPGCFWFIGTSLFTGMGGYNGAINQIVAGGFDFASQGVALVRGGKKYGYPLASALNTLCYTAWQAPHLIAGDHSAWTGYAFVLLSNSPVMAEPWTQERAKDALSTFRDAGKEATLGTKIKKFGLQILANPRPFWAVCHSTALLPPAIRDMQQGHKFMIPIYLCWYGGNIAAGLTRPKEGAYHSKQSTPDKSLT